MTIRLLALLAAVFVLGLTSALAVPWPLRLAPGEPAVVGYSADMPHIQCLAGRVIAESDPALSAGERRALWARYALSPSFEWIETSSGYTYHELEVRPYSLYERARAWVLRKPLAPRRLPALVALLSDDPRLHWAAPDALLLEWCDTGEGSGGIPPPENDGRRDAAPTGMGVTLLDDQFRSFTGSVADWASHPDWSDPLPDFEYYRECAPVGTAVAWADVLAGNEAFAKRCKLVFGTNQALALERYRAAGSPALSPVTVCMADTGVFLNHPDLAGRLHPNAIDANYRNFSIAAPEQRAAADVKITDRGGMNAVGLPRLAIKGQPAYHGTATAGLVARETAGFGYPPAVRILPVSVKSARTYALSGTRIKTPISAFIKLVACLHDNFPTSPDVGARLASPADAKAVGASLFSPSPAQGDNNVAPTGKAAVQNDGDVRVVSISASIPRSYFSATEWNVVSSLANKAAGTIYEDLRTNDRVYVFSSGNDAQAQPNKPSEQDYVIAVTATLAYDGAKAWGYAPSGEGANMGAKCVGAPGYGIITSVIYPTPNLAYLPDGELAKPRENMSTPKRDAPWVEQTNRFNATSAAAPQISALAALLYAQDSRRAYADVIALIQASTAERQVSAPWGTARGLVDYAAALGW